MPAYTLELSPAAYRDLKSLPAVVRQQIVKDHLPVIARAPVSAGRPLAGSLYGQRSYHFGRRPEYRIIYLVDGNVITVVLIGTREGIYKKAKKRS
jgi:addiction module RelE/StbE family toxin